MESRAKLEQTDLVSPGREPRPAAAPAGAAPRKGWLVPWLLAGVALGALAGWIGWRWHEHETARRALERMAELVSEPLPYANKLRFQERWSECLKAVARENHQAPERLSKMLQDFGDGLAPGIPPKGRDEVLADLGDNLFPSAARKAETLAAEARKSNLPLPGAEAELLLGNLQAVDGNLAEAEQRFRRAAELFKQSRVNGGYVKAQARLAYLLVETGRSKEAEPLWKSCIEAAGEPSGESPTPLAYYLASRGVALLAEERFAEAEPLFRESLRLEARHPLDGRRPRLIIRWKLGVALWKLKHLEEAERWMREAVTLAEQEWGPGNTTETPPHLIWDLTDVLVARGKKAEALPFAEWGQRLADHGHATTTEELLRALRLLSTAQMAVNRLSDAVATEQRTVAAADRAYGMTRVDTGLALSRLGGVLRLAGDEDEAERIYRQAVGATEMAVGPDSPEIASILTDLAVMLRGQARYTEAERYLMRAGTILDEHTPQGDPRRARTLECLGAVDAATDRVEDGETLLRRAVALVRKAPDRLTLDSARIHTELGEVLVKEGRFEAAAPLYRTALTIVAELSRRNGAPLPELALVRKKSQECLEKAGLEPKAVAERLAEAEQPAAVEALLAEQW